MGENTKASQLSLRKLLILFDLLISRENETFKLTKKVFDNKLDRKLPVQNYNTIVDLQYSPGNGSTVIHKNRKAHVKFAVLLLFVPTIEKLWEYINQLFSSLKFTLFNLLYSFLRDQIGIILKLPRSGFQFKAIFCKTRTHLDAQLPDHCIQEKTYRLMSVNILLNSRY